LYAKPRARSPSSKNSRRGGGRSSRQLSPPPTADRPLPRSRLRISFFPREKTLDPPAKNRKGLVWFCESCCADELIAVWCAAGSSIGKQAVTHLFVNFHFLKLQFLPQPKIPIGHDKINFRPKNGILFGNEISYRISDWNSFLIGIVCRISPRKSDRFSFPIILIINFVIGFLFL